MKFLDNKPIVSFLLKAFILYVIWYIAYDLWLHPTYKVDNYIINSLGHWGSKLLSLLGYELIEISPDDDITTIGIDGTHGLWIGDPCSGLSLFALFTGFIIAYPGSIKRKLLYIPIGILCIHLLNIMRVAALCMVLYYTPEYLEFNHTYTFTIMVYSIVFILWYLWVDKFSRPEQEK